MMERLNGKLIKVKRHYSRGTRAIWPNWEDLDCAGPEGVMWKVRKNCTAQSWKELCASWAVCGVKTGWNYVPVEQYTELELDGTMCRVEQYTEVDWICA